MSEIRRERLKAVGVLVLIGAIFVGWMATRERSGNSRQRQSQVLPDGSTLHLEAVLGGKNLVYDTQTKLQKLARKWPILRPFAGKNAHYRASFSYLDGEHLVALLSLSGTSRDVTSLNFGYEFADDEGWRQHINVRRYLHPSGSHTGKPLPVLLGIGTGAFPHHRKTFVLRVLDQSSRQGAKEIARFEIVNPVYRPVAAGGAAPPLPRTVREGDLEVTLHRLVAGVGHDVFNRAVRRGDDLLTRTLKKPREDEETGALTVFKVREKDQVTTGWGLASLRATDTAGCIFTNQALRSYDAGDYKCFLSQPDLWTGGGPFRLKAEFVRTGDFPEAELWTVSFAVPQTTETVRVQGEEKAVGPVRAVLDEVGGPGSQFSDGGRFWNNAAARFAFYYPPGGAPYRLELVNVVDDLGRRLQGPSSTLGEHATRMYVTYGLDLPWENGKQLTGPASTTVTMTLALTQTRTVEFDAEPEGGGE